MVIWEVGKGALSVLTNDRPSIVQCLAFSPDSATLAAGYDGAQVVLWNVATAEKRLTLHGCPNQFLCLAFSPDGKDPGVRRRGINHSKSGMSRREGPRPTWLITTAWSVLFDSRPTDRLLPQDARVDWSNYGISPVAKIES